MKILLIEDDPRQVKLAQQTLPGHELFVCGSEHEAQEYYKVSANVCKLLRPFDLMVTDLILPAGPEPGYTPSPMVGMSLFNVGLRLLAQDRIKGLALLSNFEHHVDNKEISDSSRSEVAAIQELVQIFGKSLYRDEKDKLAVAKKSPMSWNAIVVFDIHVDDYTHVLSPEGELMSKEEVYKQFTSMMAAKKKGFSLAKLFSFAVDGLLQG